MRIRHLETFLVVAEELHFGRAAARLHVAQPAVSQTIAALERSIDVELFDRSRRRVRLTPAGVVFRDEVEGILARLSTAPILARRAARGATGRLTVAFMAACALGGLASSVTRFIHAHPAIDVRLLQMGTREQQEALGLGRIDLGFSVLPDETPGLVRRSITSDTLQVFVSETHPFACLERVPIAHVLESPFLLMSRKSEPAMHQVFDQLCRAHDIEPDVVLEVDHLDTMLAFVAAGLGISLAPSAAAALRLDGVVVRPTDPPMPAGTSALWPADGLAPTAQALLSHLEADGVLEPPLDR